MVPEEESVESLMAQFGKILNWIILLEFTILK